MEIAVSEQNRSLVLLAFLEEEPSMRHQQFRQVPEAQVKAILDQWVSDDEFRISEALQLDEPFNVWATQMARASGKTFHIAINPDWEPPEQMAKEMGAAWVKQEKERVRLQLPQKNGQRRWRDIRGIEALSPKDAQQLLQQYGPDAGIAAYQNRVREVSQAEFDKIFLEAARRREKEAKAKAKTEAKTAADAEKKAKAETGE